LPDFVIKVLVFAVLTFLPKAGLGDGGEIYILSPECQPIKELKYRISTKVHQRIFSQDC